jgi:hypothetical protein
MKSTAKQLETLCITSHRLAATDRPAALRAVEEMAKALDKAPTMRGWKNWRLVIEGRRADLGVR